MKVPVLLLAFNRPELTEKVIESIKNYKPSKIYVSVDGPRKENVDDLSNIKKIRYPDKREYIT